MGTLATTIDGNGSNPGMKELLAVAEDIQLDHDKAKSIALEIEEEVRCSLSRWLKCAVV